MKRLGADGFAAMLLCAASLPLLPVAALAQASPQASVTNTPPANDFGFNLPTHLGTLSYSLTGSELIGTGYGNGSVGASTVASGNLAYLSKSENAPFSLVYSGGYLFSTVPGSNSSSTFQNIAASQVLRTKSWVYVVSDSLQYLPESPTTGLSGIAGVGDVGVFPVQTGLGPAQSILTDYSNRLANGLQGSATWQATPSLDLEGSGFWDVLNGSSEISSDQYGGTFGPNFRIDARNQIGADVFYSRDAYPNLGSFEIESYGVNLNYTRAWTRRFSTVFSVGPEETHGQTNSAIPSQINFAGTISLTYATRTTGFFAGYSRGVNAGSGVIYGSLSDIVTAGANRPLGRDWVLGLNGGYSHNTSLASYSGLLPKFQDEYGAAQLSRRISESLSAFASYTAIHQTTNNVAGVPQVFSGFNNTFSIGITFAPRPLIRGH